MNDIITIQMVQFLTFIHRSVLFYNKFLIESDTCLCGIIFLQLVSSYRLIRRGRSTVVMLRSIEMHGQPFVVIRKTMFGKSFHHR